MVVSTDLRHNLLAFYSKIPNAVLDNPPSILLSYCLVRLPFILLSFCLVRMEKSIENNVRCVPLDFTDTLPLPREYHDEEIIEEFERM